MVSSVTLLALALVCATIALGQDQPEDNPKLGRVGGRVVESKSGEPVRKAVVLLRRDENARVGSLTDADGKFTFRDLEPGVYPVSVQKDGWVVARESKGLRATVTAGQTAPALTLKLQRAAAISGRITDADGDPLSGVAIQVTPNLSGKSGRGSAWATTNERGEYRAFNVAPGLYRICATYGAPRLMDVQMQPAPVAYPKVCYPGTPQGSVLPVESGAELQGIDFQMIPAHAVKVTGRVISQMGEKPAFALVTLQPADGTSGGSSQPVTTFLRGGEGAFELQGVLPGRYRLTVAGASLDNELKVGASRTIDVGETDLQDVEIIVGPPRKIEGRVIVPEGRKAPSLTVLLQPRDRGSQGGGFAQVSADGTFSFREVASGDYDVLLASTGPGDDLYVSAIRQGDSDALADGVRSSVSGNLEVVLKANGGSLTCSVTGEKDEVAPGGRVVLVPDPPRQGQFALMGECRTDANGACEIQGITPGEYHIYAFPPEADLDPRDPDTLKAFEKYGEAVKISEGEHHDMQLKAAPVE